MRLDDGIARLAADQYSVVATWQLRALGLTETEVGRLRRSSAWTEVSPRVLLRTGAPWGPQQELMAALLDASPGAAIAGPTAAAMWGAPGFRIEPIHVVRHKGIARRPSTLAIVHEVVDLLPAHIKVMDGIAVISPARVVCELTASHPQRAARVLDQFWSDRLLDGRTFRRTVGELAGRGRKGSPLMRELDRVRGPGYVPPASGLEARFEEISPEGWLRQVDLGDEEWCGRVDFRHPRLPIVVEVQSEKYHTSLVDKVADAERVQRLEAAGVVVVQVWDTEVFHRPWRVREEIQAGRRRLWARAA